ncbi:MAG: phosphoribosyltransferase family protein [Elusimicrobiota bacterium]|jgi:putative phosphoribosyl transferase
MFRDRRDAGRALAERLLALAKEKPFVLGLQRGGVPVAYEIAKALAAPLDVIVVRKLGAPNQPELAVGSVCLGLPEPVLYEDLIRRLAVPKRHLDAEIAAARAEAERHNKVFREDRPFPDLAGRTVVVADDGLATGMSMKAALEALRRLPTGRLVAAVPVASPEGLRVLEGLADEVVCLSAPWDFMSVSGYYADFSQVSDDEVLALLKGDPAH